MKLGVVLNGRRTAAEVAELALLAEENGLAHFWLSGGSRTKDHFLRLALAGNRTRRIQLGPVAISPFEMHPVRIGLSLMTLDEIAEGRASIVLGGGGDLAATLGVPLKNRVQAVSETIDIIHALSRGGELNYHGESFQVDGLFSPWKEVRTPPLYVGANRPRMLRMAAERGDGIMVTDMPLDYVRDIVSLMRSKLVEAGRDGVEFRFSNWFVWNVQESEEKARRQALRTMGFRLYYIQDVASKIGLSRTEALELHRRQPSMIRTVLDGGQPESLPNRIADLLIDHLTISGSLENLDDHIERLHQFEKRGLTEMALSVEGDPASAITLLGEKVLPAVNGE